ncbi:MAG: hypothetical protein WEF99_07290 [Thermoanaerobaculia bacterium]
MKLLAEIPAGVAAIAAAVGRASESPLWQVIVAVVLSAATVFAMF